MFQDAILYFQTEVVDWSAGRRARSWREALKQQPYGIGRERS
jgi:hypothetical protein